MQFISTPASLCRAASDFASIQQTLLQERQSDLPTRLHCNETAFDLPHALKQELALKMADLAWNRYPDFYNTELTALMAQHVGVLPENILLGNGSSQLIQQIFSCCAKFLSAAIIEHPTFTFYHQVCHNERLPYQTWQIADDGSYDLDTFPATEEPALVVLTSPNNPLGTALPQQLIETLLLRYPHCIFVIDEAYAEFADGTAVSLVQKYTNLLVIKTLSKGYGLPSVRFGYLAGSAELVQLLKKFTVPFTVNSFTELIVNELITNPAVSKAVRINRERVKNLRDFVYHQLHDMSSDDSFSVQASAANFLLLRFEDDLMLQQLKSMFDSNQIVVSYPLPNCLRLTIGTEVEMSRVLRIIRKGVSVAAVV
ncbi:pyridoxal phosphate-dependent aminotransferase [Runella slithyformis]|uniref:Histidinol-phosphate transaminase n=1 Tax=Runella slithyformis (strain ATCC 29530 / DSM 19594 / LMG 11500 / NCIMB 11436 / LSU 4) TaxID=761193 RepID=A0A7U3ZL49_RUNSL|nr:histidinol-phosphate transaminase [Runella slithyformis]AEI49215.1 Histidinol-phosphate transaminase [Runella slithyformis DSM 19594]